MPHTPERSIPRHSAFTIAELIIVMIVIGVLAGIAGPRYANAISHYRLDSAAKRLAADFGLARADAKNSSAPQPIVFNTTTGVYTMTGVKTLDNRSNNYSVNLATDPYFVKITSTSFPSSTVTFDMFGVPDNGGNVVLTANGSTKTITLDPASGTVTVQ